MPEGTVFTALPFYWIVSLRESIKLDWGLLQETAHGTHRWVYWGVVEHINLYITYFTLLEDPGEKDPSALSNKNRTNPFIAYQSCELCKRQCFKIFLLVANSYKIIFGAWVFIICTLSFIIAILRSPALFLFIILLLILTYSILLYIIQVTLNPSGKKNCSSK